MKTKQVIESTIEELRTAKFLFVRPEKEADDGFFVDNNDKESVSKAAEILKLTPQAVEAINESLEYMVEELIDHLKADLEDIWERLE